MMINRHNYEEFFLLYVDKELDAEGFAAVESFVSQNPDLAKELDILQRATLEDNTVLFTQKELLYKKEDSISIHNYEEYFLLGADNELNEQQAAEVENFVLKHPELQNEFTILQKTRLHPEVVAFAGKEKLYRREKSVRRIVPLVWVRMGVAAAIVGIAYISFINITDTNSSAKNRMINSKRTTAKIVVEKNKADKAQKLVTENPLASLNTTKERTDKVKKLPANKAAFQKVRNQKVEIIENKQESVATNVKKPENKIEQQPVVNIGTVKKEPELAEVPIEKNHFSDNNNTSGLVNPSEKNAVMINEPIVKEEKPLATHAVYLETDNVEEERNVYIGSAEINKNKLKGLLKKASVFLDKKIRRNDE
ncbi:anti-sigma factor family protein [Segetibacter koreensis]|uniref:anti-sigma factor family protein n=1 Tax=Segetibacter koreensis TaxID=398037 RepID=UPI0012FCC50B|nr:hypothetical protein [Segetibacter koreensis]